MRRKETLGFPVPLGSLALFGVPSCHPWEPASSLSHAGRRGGWKDLQPRCQGGQSGQGCLAKHSHTLPCRGDARRHPGLETFRPPGTNWRLHPSAPISGKGPWQPLLHPLSHPSCGVAVASLLAPMGAWHPTLGAPLGGCSLQGTLGEGLWPAERGHFCDKGCFPNTQFCEFKGLWVGRNKSPKTRKKNNTKHLEAAGTGGL